MTHDQSSNAHSDVPVSKGISPMAKVLMAVALVVIFIQGGFTVISSGFGRHPPAEAVKLDLPAQAP
ncbi:MAG: hypothetical protein ABSB70_19555 [Candidatus Velthaea sp.]|jgi:hypothetical protein